MNLRFRWQRGGFGKCSFACRNVAFADWSLFGRDVIWPVDGHATRWTVLAAAGAGAALALRR